MIETKKITLATFKSFVNKNREKLFIRTLSSFDPMIDCVSNVESEFKPIRDYDTNKVFTASDINEHTLGIAGVWLVGQSRDYFNHYFREGFIGIEVSNCCGNFVVAIKE